MPIATAGAKDYFRFQMPRKQQEWLISQSEDARCEKDSKYYFQFFTQTYRASRKIHKGSTDYLLFFDIGKEKRLFTETIIYCDEHI